MNFRAGCLMRACLRRQLASPTVAEGKARLRAIVTATHKRADFERACELIAETGRGLGLI